LKVYSKYVMTFKPWFQYDKFHGNTNSIFHTKSHICSSSFVNSFEQTKHQSILTYFMTQTCWIEQNDATKQ
jgi:hypothetical protein